MLELLFCMSVSEGKRGREERSNQLISTPCEAKMPALHGPTRTSQRATCPGRGGAGRPELQQACSYRLLLLQRLDKVSGFVDSSLALINLTLTE